MNLNRIYTNFDEAKDKPFELELSWISEASKWEHKLVPDELLAEAKAAGVRAQEAEDESDEDDDDATAAAAASS